MGRGAPKIKLQEHSNALNLLCFYSCWTKLYTNLLIHEPNPKFINLKLKCILPLSWVNQLKTGKCWKTDFSLSLIWTFHLMFLMLIWVSDVDLAMLCSRFLVTFLLLSLQHWFLPLWLWDPSAFSSSDVWVGVRWGHHPGHGPLLEREPVPAVPSLSCGRELPLPADGQAAAQVRPWVSGSLRGTLWPSGALLFPKQGDRNVNKWL